MDLSDPESDERQTPSETKSAPGTDRLWEEYKLIQAKIDKIGEFQFKVKSWSATLLGAVLFGGAATSRFPLALFCALFLAPMFHLSERRQRQLSQRLGRRASALERAFSELPPISDIQLWARIQRRIPSLHSVPGIASTIVGNKEEKWTWQWADRKKIGQWFVNHSDDVFYMAQYVLVIALLIGTGAAKIYEVWLKH